VLNDYYARVRGRQEKITDSRGMAPALQNATSQPIPGQQAVPPFTTQVEALRLVQTYVSHVRAVNPKAATQLRASSPRVLDLVYIPCLLNAPAPVSWLGPLSPSSLGDPNAFRGFLA
jgi:hypothetical protein